MMLMAVSALPDWTGRRVRANQWLSVTVSTAVAFGPTLVPHAIPPLSLVVSVCCARDLDTWAEVSRAVVRHIRATRYQVVVPDIEVPAFAAVTHPRYEIVGEEAYVGSIRAALAERLGDRMRHRLGWYIQQFAKIEAMRRAGPGLALIWDADTLPLRDLAFQTDSGTILVYSADEYHQPYFATIERLLALPRATDFSFIAQCLAMPGDWVEACCAEMARSHGGCWMQAVVAAIDPAQASSFSEYETLGTWMVHRHSDSVAVLHDAWFRHGSGLLGPLATASPRALSRLAESFDFVAFERWRPRGRRLLQLRFWLSQLPVARQLFFPEKAGREAVPLSVGQAPAVRVSG